MRLKVLLRETHDGHKTYNGVNNKGQFISQQQQHNNFVRLHPKTALALYNKIKSNNFNHELESSNSNDFQFTQKHELTNSSSVEFLPLALTISSDHYGIGPDKESDSCGRSTIYVSYNGGAILDESGIEIPSHLWALNHGDYIDVTPLPQVKDALSIQLEPVTINDWELIDLNSLFLEDGGLLQQISIVYPNQVLCLRLGTDLVHVKVLLESFYSTESNLTDDEVSYISTDFDSSDEDSFSSISHKDSTLLYHEDTTLKTYVPVLNENIAYKNENNSINSDDNTQSICRNEYLRLVVDTEVTVVARPRSTKFSAMYPFSKRLRIQPTEDDFTEAMKNLFADDPSIKLVRSPPHFSAYIHSKTLSSHVPGWDELNIKHVSNGYSYESARPKYAYAMMYESSFGLGYNENGDCEDEKNQGTLIKLQELDDVNLGHIVIHNNLGFQQDLCPLVDFVQLQLLNEGLLKDISQKLFSRIEQNTVTLETTPIQTSISNFQIFLNGNNDSWKVPDSFGFHIVSPESKVKDNYECLTCLENFISFLSDFLHNNPETPLYLSSGSVISSYADNQSFDQRTLVSYQITINIENQEIINRESKEGEIPLAISVRDLLNFLISHMENKPKSPFVSFRNELLHTNTGNNTSRRILHRKFFTNMLPHTLSHPRSFKEEICFAEEHLSVLCKRTDKVLQYKSLRLNEFTLGDIIITGETGCGKTHLALEIAAKLRMKNSMATIYIDTRQLQVSSNLRLRDILTELTLSFHEAYFVRPSLLILDNLDALTPSLDNEGDNIPGSVHHQNQHNPVMTAQVKSISDHLQYLLDDLKTNCKDEKVTVLCTSQRTDSLSPSLKNRFLTHIKVPTLGHESRLVVFKRMLTNKRGSFLNDIDLKILEADKYYPDFGKKTEGYRPKDLQVLATLVDDLIYSNELKQLPDKEKTNDDCVRKQFQLDLVLKECMEKALTLYVPIHLQSLDLGNKNLKVSFASIGGLFKAKKILTDIILRPVKYEILYRNSPIKLPTGILLFGPPGCGKTYLVPALAHQCNYNLITCRGPELLDKYIGASEEKVRHLFDRAYAAAPSVLFLDDFDALAPRRGMDNTGVTDRVVNQLLTFLDGVESLSERKNAVYIIAATSRPDKIDPALLRPGRLEKHLYIGFPENEAEWIDLFKKISSTMNLDQNLRAFIQSHDFSLFLQDNKTSITSFSAADMKAIFDTANLNAVHEFLNKDISSNEGNRTQLEGKLTVSITKDHLLKAIVSTKPSLSEKDKINLETIYTRSFQETQIKIKSKNFEFSQPGDLKTALR